MTLEGLGGCVMFARVMLHFNEMRFAFFVFFILCFCMSRDDKLLFDSSVCFLT